VFERDEDAMDISQDTDYEWILEIYSPMISEKLIKAKDNNDYYEMRRLTYYALQNTFSNDWNEKVTFGFELPKENPVAKLKRNTNAKYGGVRVYYTINKEVDGKYVGIMSRTTPLYFPPQQTGPIDKYFPVDIKLYEGQDKKSTGDSYYGENDFIASFDEASIIIVAGNGSGIMYGHLRGFGYCEFYYTYKGVGLDITFYAHGVIQGKSNYKPYGPQSIAGKGEQKNTGAGNTGFSKWTSINNDGQITFSGISNSFSIGIGKGALTKIVTCTKLLFPLKLDENVNKSFIDCCCELKIEDCCNENE
jgi:hypothetical protein